MPVVWLARAGIRHIVFARTSRLTSARRWFATQLRPSNSSSMARPTFTHHHDRRQTVRFAKPKAFHPSRQGVKVRAITPRAGVWIETGQRKRRRRSTCRSPLAQGCGSKRDDPLEAELACAITPRAGVWIETGASGTPKSRPIITPRAGVWIETGASGTPKSRPIITPRAGVWIETGASGTPKSRPIITPRAGVWIETHDR